MPSYIIIQLYKCIVQLICLPASCHHIVVQPYAMIVWFRIYYLSLLVDPWTTCSRLYLQQRNKQKTTILQYVIYTRTKWCESTANTIGTGWHKTIHTNLQAHWHRSQLISMYVDHTSTVRRVMPCLLGSMLVSKHNNNHQNLFFRRIIL